ncbi:CHASE domain-containing protein [uncultured Pseudomonas sp.]|uniref:CHASE domain-containing hybrid sensor histidine kinase/response regulator n=1 Tax=uncultured Pseudomonas sp. TaxID=114707 RepID=UPI0025CD37FB|nr:CHASE domain-containing protein [uncultured Pseudomonas sp.]
MKTNSLKWLCGWTSLVLLAGLALSWFASHEQAKAIERYVMMALKDAGQGIADDLQTRLRVYEYRLRGLRGAIHMMNPEDISGSQMSRYSQGRNIEKEYPGASGFGFIRRVPQNKEGDFLRAVRADGRPDFALSRFSAHQGDRYIIQFIDPSVRNIQALGLDIASEPRRRDAAIQAMRSGEATLSAPITLQQSNEERLRAFLFLLPVYSTPETPPDVAQREASAIGWTYAPLAMSEVMASLDPANHRLHLTLYDVSDGRQLIYQTHDDEPEPEVVQVYAFEREIYGRVWRMEVGAHPLFITSLDLVPPARVFFIGMLATLLLTAMVGNLMLSRLRKHEVIAGQARLATIVENSSDAIIGEALDGRIITWNRAAEQMFGYTEDEVLGRPLAPLLVPLSRVHEDEQLLERVARGERGSTLETQRLHKEGRLIDVTITCSLIREADGSILGAAKMMHDITDRKRVERYLMEFNAELEQQVNERTAELTRVAGLLQAVLDASSEVSIIATDTEGRVVVFNRGAELLLGYSNQEIVGQKTAVGFHLRAEMDARSLELSREYGILIEGVDVFTFKAQLEGAETRQWTYVRKDGSHVQVSMVITPIRTETGEIIGHLAIAQDITERLRHSAELNDAKSIAEAANAAKSLFLANMSHEIRTPMNAVIGIAHLLQNTSLNEQQRQLLTKLQIAGRTLLGIINDILDIAKIEAGEMRLESNPFSPRQLLGELNELFTSQAQEKGLRFSVKGAGQLPNLLIGDALRVNQILMNLVGNALKFTTQGGVEVSASRESGDAEHCWLRFSVQDTGCGIAADVLGQLFSPFTQADASTTRRFGGTGLGLSVVRGLAEQMGGEVGVRSELGMGSEFWVRLPFRIGQSDVEPAVPGSNLEVLVLSDNVQSSQALQRLCRGLGWRVCCPPGEEALQPLLDERRQRSGPLPDVLLLDWQQVQPGELQRVREIAGLPVILVTRVGTEQAVADLPVDWLLLKPLDSSALFNAVNACIARCQGSTARVIQATRLDTSVTRWLSGLELLLVDDSEINLEVASLLLEQQGAKVHTCTNGLQALERLRQAPEFFDAVLMDVQMPEMDGYEATRRLRGDLGLTRLPVLALTAGALAEERRQAEQAGMDDFLTKPLDPAALIRAIRQAVERVRGVPLQVSQVPQSSAQGGDWPQIDGIDSQEVATRLGHDVELFLSSLKRFFAEFAGFGDVSTIQQRAIGEPMVVAAELHKLRGVANLLGARELGRLAAQAETALRESADAAPSLHGLTEAYHELREQTAALQVSSLPAPQAEADPETAREALTRLRESLGQRDLAALDLFALAAPALQASAGRPLVEQLWQAVEGLEFERALDLLERADL